MPAGHPHYRGRFAPSPTGPLHLGSLIAALASYLDARHHGGSWLVRIDDLDPPREQAGAAASILKGLECHALQWDETITWQSERGPAYDKALAQLAAQGKTFYCDCSRAQLGHGGRCQGQCRQRQDRVSSPCATRIAIDRSCIISLDDALQGYREEALGKDPGDFIIKRRDGLYAYQLAVVVDDAAAGITHVVRGSDLLDTTLRQVFLQQQLGLPTPHYCHLPVITNDSGQKYSKQNHAPTLDNDNAANNLRQALAFLAQDPPPTALEQAADILEWATAHWSAANIPRVMAAPASRTHEAH